MIQMQQRLQQLRHHSIAVITTLLLASTLQAADTLQFRYQYGLIVLSGKLNGVPADFVFDTGSNVTVTTPGNNAAAGITPSKKTTIVRDVNNSVDFLQRVQINSVQFGSLVFKNIKGITASMPALTCDNLVLLGQDVIRQCNWIFDFDKQQVIISKQPFAQEAGATIWKVAMKFNKPHVPLRITADTSLQCLIDMGFSGILDIGKPYAALQNLLRQKQLNGALYQQVTSGGMGVFGFGNYSLEEVFTADSLWLPGLPLATVPVNVESNGFTKLGAQFFAAACRQLVLHHQSNEYELRLRDTLRWAAVLEDASVNYENGKLVIKDKNISTGSTAHALSLGEEIRAINGKTAADFADACSYWRWRFSNRYTAVLIERIDGTRLEVGSVLLGHPNAPMIRKLRRWQEDASVTTER